MKKQIKEEIITRKHTRKNYPFLIDMSKDVWLINNNNKHILINAYERGRKQALEEVEKIKEDVNFLIGYCQNVKNDEPKKYAISDLDYIIQRLRKIKSKIKEMEK